MDSVIEKEIFGQTEKTDRQLLEEMSGRLEKMEKRAKRRSIIGWIAAVLVLALAAVLVLSFIPRYQALKAQYDTVADTVQQLSGVISTIDIETLQSAADFVGSVDYEKLQQLGDVLAAIDTEELKTQMEEISDLMNKLGELNTDQLVDNINLIIEKLQPFMNLFKR